MFPSITWSSTPVTVTSTPVFHAAGAITTSAGTVPSFVSLETSGIVTLCVGSSEMITSNRTVTVRRLGAADPQVAIVECTENPELGSSCTTTEGEQAAERYAQIVLAVEAWRPGEGVGSGGELLGMGCEVGYAV